MKSKPLMILLIAAIWGLGSGWWYVCKIKGACSSQPIPNTVDTDQDGLPDELELRFKLDPNSKDSDGDGLYDRAEWGDHSSMPSDTDQDGIVNPLDDDDDNDGHKTADEGVDPNKDGKPDDAQDVNGNGVADYLDPEMPEQPNAKQSGAIPVTTHDASSTEEPQQPSDASHETTMATTLAATQQLATKAEEEKTKQEAAEKERLAKEKAEQEAAEKAEQERLAKEKVEKDAAEKAEQERLAKEKTEKEAAEKAEQERLAKEKTEKEAAEKAEQERLAKERQATKQENKGEVAYRFIFHFDSASTKLKPIPSYDKKFKSIANYLRRDTGKKLEVHIVGFADEEGSPAANRRYALERARTVQRRMMDFARSNPKAIKARTKVSSRGASEPVKNKDGSVNLKRSRRVEVRLVKP